MLGWSDAGTQPIRTDNRTAEKVVYCSVGSTARIQRGWCGSLRGRGFARGLAIPEARAAGIHTTTGEPFVWFLSILPIVATFLVINVGWGAVILARWQRKGGLFWLLAAVVWLGAIAIDFAHH